MSVTSTVGPFELTFTVDPARVGSNEIHLYVLDPKTGQPAAVDEIRVDASLPAAGIGPLSFPTTPAGPGHALVAAAQLPLAGAWRFHLAVRQGEFDEWMAVDRHPDTKGMNHMRKLLLLIAAVAATLAVPAALAHVSPTQSTAAAGSSAIIGFTIGHGCEASPTRQVTIQIPAGVTSVKPQPKAGWRITIKRGTLPEPVKDFAGNTVKVGVLEVTWTGGPLPDAYFDTFYLRLGHALEGGQDARTSRPSSAA